MDNSRPADRATASAPGELRSAATRQALLRAAAEVIAKVGWHRGPDPAIADRAGLPHGAISYHFAGKDQLLRQAAVAASAAALKVPVALAQRAPSVAALIEQTIAWYAAGGMADPSVRLLLETAREASRDEGVRAPTAAMLRSYREHLTELVRKDQQAGNLNSGVPPDGVAAIVAALLDGLLVHLTLDPALELGSLVTALQGLLGEPR
jgi:AcrR family transcriptional regulator